MKKSSHLAVCLVSLAGAAMAPATANAQKADEPTAAADGDILVTARKTQERLIDIPVSVTVVTGKNIEESGSRNIQDLAAQVPSFNFRTDNSIRAFASFRGIGGLGGDTPGVALFIDGVYQPAQTFFSSPLLDVERVEFLKGPQGTLYGRNTLGGAISIISRQPGNELEVRGGASMAEGEAFQVFGAAGGAIVPDKLLFRVAAQVEKSEGFIQNITLKQSGSKRDTSSLRGTLSFIPSPGLRFDIVGYQNFQDNDGQGYAPTTGINDVRYRTENGDRSFVRFRTTGGSFKARLALADGHELQSITALDELHPSAEQYDIDYSAAPTLLLTRSRKSRTFSQELRYTGKLSDSIDVLLGGFYWDDKATIQRQQLFFSGTRIQDSQNVTRSENLAAFGNITVRPIDRLELVGGIRFDSNTIDFRFINNLTTDPARLLRQKADVWQPKGSITYRWTDDFMTFASIARGYRSGGFNNNTALPESQRTYGPEFTWNYEVGAKGSFFGGKLSGGVTLFRIVNSDAQQNDIVLTGSGPANAVLNTGRLVVKGVEVDFSMRPTPGLTLSGGFSYNDFSLAPGKVLGSADKLKIALSARYEFAVGSQAKAFLVADGSHFGPTFLSNTQEQRTKTLANAQIGVRMAPGVEIAAFVRNFLDTKYYVVFADKAALGTAQDLGLAGDRRQFGIRLGFDFK